MEAMHGGYTPWCFFHYTCDQRFFTHGILLGVGGISGTLLCATSLVIGFTGPLIIIIIMVSSQSKGGYMSFQVVELCKICNETLNVWRTSFSVAQEHIQLCMAPKDHEGSQSLRLLSGVFSNLFRPLLLIKKINFAKKNL